MYVICGQPAITERIPAANMKFNGTRLLSVAGQVQQGIFVPIGAHTVHWFVRCHLENPTARLDPGTWEAMSGFDGLLWGGCLMCVECLFVICLHFWYFFDRDFEKALHDDYHGRDPNSTPANMPLLNCDDRPPTRQTSAGSSSFGTPSGVCYAEQAVQTEEAYGSSSNLNLKRGAEVADQSVGKTKVLFKAGRHMLLCRTVKVRE